MTHYKKVYGLTGGISTGKSTVSDILKNRGYDIVDADKIAHGIMLKDNLAYKEIIGYFGKSILGNDGEINRKTLGGRVFGNKEKLSRLNAITHPYIMDEIKRQRDNILRDKDMVFLDIPLLFEIEDVIREYEIGFDGIILVYIDRQRQVERLKLRDNISGEEAEKKIKSQMNIEDKVKKSDYIIDNTGSLEELEDKVDRLLVSLEK